MGGGWVKRWKFLGETNKFNHLVSFTFEEFPFPFRFLFSAPLSRRAWWGQVLASEYQRLHYFTTCVTQWVNIQDGIGGSFAHSKKFKASSLWWSIKLFWKIVFNLGIHATIVAKNTYSVPHLCRVWLKLGRHGLFWFRPIIGCTLYLKLFAQISLGTTAQVLGMADGNIATWGSFGVGSGTF